MEKSDSLQSTSLNTALINYTLRCDAWIRREHGKLLNTSFYMVPYQRDKLQKKLASFRIAWSLGAKVQQGIKELTSMWASAIQTGMLRPVLFPGFHTFLEFC